MSVDYKTLMSKPRTIYASPQDFLDAAAQYFTWATLHPLKEDDNFHYKGAVVKNQKDKVRAFTRKGLASHLGMPEGRLKTYTERGGDWADAVERVEDVIETQKFENAAVGLMNANFIARDLKMADKQEVDAAVEDKTPVGDATPEEHRAIHVHPDDPDPTGLMSGVMPRPLFSQAQLDAGMPFPYV